MNDKNSALTVALSTMNKNGVRAQLGQAGSGRPENYTLFYMKDGAMRVMFVKKSEQNYPLVSEEVAHLVNRSHEEQLAQGNNDLAFKPIPAPVAPVIRQASLEQLRDMYKGN